MAGRSREPGPTAVIGAIHHDWPRTLRARRIIACATVAAILASTSACTDPPGDPGDEPGFTVSDSAGVEVVESFRPTWGDSSRWEIGEAPSLRIGVVDGAPEYQFSRVSGAVRLSDGRIAVLEQQATELRLFAPDGSYLATWARGGEGPGEMGIAQNLQRLPGDTLQVLDRLHRIRFAPDGTLADERHIDWNRVSAIGEFVVECSGLPLMVLDEILVCPRRADAESTAEGLRRPMSLAVRLPWDYSAADTLGELLSIEQYRYHHRGDPISLIHSLYGQGMWALDSSNRLLYFGERRKARIEVWQLDGGLRRVIRRAGLARPPTDDEIEAGFESAASMYETIFEATGRTLPSVSDLRDALPLPDSIAPYSAMTVDSEAYLWLAAHELAPGDSGWYEIFDPAGRLLGGVAAPRTLTIHEIGEDYLLGVRYDELRVPFVEVYPLTRRQ